MKEKKKLIVFVDLEKNLLRAFQAVDIVISRKLTL